MLKNIHKRYTKAFPLPKEINNRKIIPKKNYSQPENLNNCQDWTVGFHKKVTTDKIQIQLDEIVILQVTSVQTWFNLGHKYKDTHSTELLHYCTLDSYV